MNCAPGQGPDCEFAAKIGDGSFAARYRGGFPEGLDGEYVDSAELYVTAPLDFNRRNFAGMDTPLVFSSGDFRPCVFKGMMGYEYVRGAWSRARAIGRRTMANGTPLAWWWLADGERHASCMVVACAAPRCDGYGNRLGAQRGMDAVDRRRLDVFTLPCRSEAVLFSDEHRL